MSSPSKPHRVRSTYCSYGNGERRTGNGKGWVRIVSVEDTCRYGLRSTTMTLGNLLAAGGRWRMSRGFVSLQQCRSAPTATATSSSNDHWSSTASSSSSNIPVVSVGGGFVTVTATGLSRSQTAPPSLSRSQSTTGATTASSTPSSPKFSFLQHRRAHPPFGLSQSRPRYFSSTAATMVAQKIDGTAIAKGIRERLAVEITEKQKLNPRYRPTLRIIQGTISHNM